MEHKENNGYQKVPILEEAIVQISRLPQRESVYVEPIVPSSPSRTFLYIAACIANIANFICGTSIAWSSPELPQLKNLTTTPLDYIITPPEEARIGSYLALSAIVGPFVGGALADMIGRKRTLLVGAVPFLIGYSLNSIANSVYYFYISRIFCGVGLGIISTVVPMYVGEIADDEVRGSLGSFMQLFIVNGLLYSYAVGPYVSIRTFNISLLIAPITFLISFALFIPESPYYLIQNGSSEDALEALIKLRGNKAVAQKNLEIIRTQVEEDIKTKGSFVNTLKTTFSTRGLRMALFLSVSLMIFQQFSGINIVLFYSQDIFTDAKVSLAPEVCTIIIGIVQILACMVTPILEKKKGKRFLLILSGICMAIALGVFSYYFYLKDNQHKDVTSIGWVPIFSLVLFIIAFSLGFGPLAWSVMGELFPGNIKSVASSVTSAFCWILAFFLTNYFGVVATMIGKAASFGFFMVCCLTASLFVFKFVPETTGKSLNEIQAILSGEKH